MGFTTDYLIISLLVATVDIYFGYRSIRLNRKWAASLGFTCILAAAVDLSYLVTILTGSYTVASIFSSIYFICIDLMLNSLAYFVWHYVINDFSKRIKKWFYICTSYMIFEIICFLVNPFFNLMFGLSPRDTGIARFPFSIHLLGSLHLAYSYAIVAFVFLVLLWKALRVPRAYKRQYILGASSLLLVVLINAVFLFLPNMGLLSLLDVSVLAYSVSAYLLYQCFYGYTRRGMLNKLKTTVFSNIDQGIILFDYEDNLLLYNRTAIRFLPTVSVKEGLPLIDFLTQCGLRLNPAAEKTSIQCYIEDPKDNSTRPLRCDFRVLRNKYGETIGKLFVFADVKSQTDLLTGFHNLDVFEAYMTESMGETGEAVAVVICDIIGLSLINSTEGHDVGDKALKTLAELLRKHFKQDAYYLRGNEANIILLCRGLSDDEINRRMDAIKAEYRWSIEYAADTIDGTEQDIATMIDEVSRSLQTRKLINQESHSYHILNSLMQTLQECDSDTEAHVQRTRMLAERLAQQMKLSSVQTAKLSLLSLMHDIGKIGVPLEILNKPGKLTEEEWAVIKSHTEKGYQIAISSPELASIAQEIRHHHERWDGKGYPDGLTRESIPLLARIIAVVDAYDAMVMNRSYKYAISAESAMLELRRCAGTQFDPIVVSEFLQMLQDSPELAYTDTSGTNLDIVPVQSELKLPLKSHESEVYAVRYGSYKLDNNNQVVSVDSVFTEITGYDEKDILESKLTQEDLIPPKDRVPYFCVVNEQLRVNKMAILEHDILCKDGSIIPVFCCGRVYYDSVVRQNRSEVTIFRYEGTHMKDRLTAEEEAKYKVRLEKWENTYRRDSLTGLLNRTPYASDVEILLQQENQRLLMFMLDVDRFKQYNDQYGHRAGDELLINVAHALSASVRTNDLVCRMGGDEFSAVIVLPLSSSRREACECAERVFIDVCKSLRENGVTPCVSMGAALSDGNKNTFLKLYEAADESLYVAKESGRLCLAVEGKVCETDIG